MEYRMGQTIYHKDVYNYKEPLEVVGITKDKLLLKGDYSGGTHPVTQSEWLPIEGASHIHNYAYKRKVRNDAITIDTLLIPVDRSDDNMVNSLREMVNAVLTLTNDL